MRPIQQSSVSLGLIEVIPIKGRLNVFSRLFETSAGYSLEIFRGDIPITSITHRNPEKRWSWDILVEADTIVKVKLSPVFATFRGQLRTLDQYFRAYTLEIRLHVSHPSLFARLYTERDDAIILVGKELERLLNGYTQSKYHNAVNPSDINSLVMGSIARNADAIYGIAIEGVYGLTVALDPRFAQIQDIHQNTSVEKARIKHDADIKAFSLEAEQPLQNMEDQLAAERLARQAEQQRIQQMLDKQHERTHIVQDTFVAGLTKRIAEDFNQNYTVEEVWNANSVLGNTFAGPSPHQIAGPDANERQPLQIEEGKPTQPDTNTQQPYLRPARKDAGHNVHAETPYFRPARKNAPPPSDSSKNDIIEGDFKSIPLPDIAPTPEPQKKTAQKPTDPHYIARLGIKLVRLSEDDYKDLVDHYGSEDETMFVMPKFLILEVDPDGPTKKKLFPGDYLSEVEHTPIFDAQSVHTVLNAYPPEKEVQVRILRFGQVIEIQNIKLM